MTHSELIDAYDRARFDYEAAPVGSRADRFIKFLVAERVLASRTRPLMCSLYVLVVAASAPVASSDPRLSTP